MEGTPRRATGRRLAAAEQAARVVALIEDGAAVVTTKLQKADGLRSGRPFWPGKPCWLDRGGLDKIMTEAESCNSGGDNAPSEPKNAADLRKTAASEKHFRHYFNMLLGWLSCHRYFFPCWYGIANLTKPSVVLNDKTFRYGLCLLLDARSCRRREYFGANAVNRQFQHLRDSDGMLRRHALPHPHGCSGDLETLSDLAGEAALGPDCLQSRVNIGRRLRRHSNSLRRLRDKRFVKTTFHFWRAVAVTLSTLG